MSKVISIHSFRGGTGKSNISANVATILAMRGQRVGVIDTDIQSPGIHILFGIPGDSITHSLNDYLWGNCSIAETAHDVTHNLGTEISGKVFLIPSSVNPSEITRILRGGYDVRVFTQGIRDLISELKLDTLVIDTHPGLHEETLVSLALSHSLLIIMRPDSQDYEGTGVTINVARELKVPNMLLVVNKAPESFNIKDIIARVEAAYDCPVAAVIQHSEEMMTLASSGVFVLHYPNHPTTQLLKDIAQRLIQ